MKTASASVRQQKILQALAGREEVSAVALARQFRVTPMTIWRDLEVLGHAKRITRTHGGALLSAPVVAAFAFHARQQCHLAEKIAIGRTASQLVKPGMTVILDTGTTTLEVARALGGIPRLKVLTSSLAIASALLTHDDLELVLLGGTVSKGSPDLCGALTEDNLATFRADLAFVGADAMDKHGLYTRNQGIARVSRAMIANAQRTILVADSSKFGRTAFVRITAWDAVDGWVTDNELPADARRWANKAVRSLVQVSAEN
ncbi:MAG: DeoR/GlpR family DNA-binding transcription regulator [bacterium]